MVFNFTCYVPNGYMEIKNLEVGAARYLVVVSQLKVCIILSDRSGTSQSSGLLNRFSINDSTSAANAASQRTKTASAMHPDVQTDAARSVSKAQSGSTDKYINVIAYLMSALSPSQSIQQNTYILPLLFAPYGTAVNPSHIRPVLFV